MWEKILRRNQTGYRFTRQKPIDHFILDFYCAKLRLGIEVDGAIHLIQEEYDLKRSLIIKKYNIHIIRYSNSQVVKNSEGVRIDVINHCLERKVELQSNSS